MILDIFLIGLVLALAWLQGRWLINIEDEITRMNKVLERHEEALNPFAMPVKTIRKEGRHEDTGH